MSEINLREEKIYITKSVMRGNRGKNSGQKVRGRGERRNGGVNITRWIASSGLPA